MARITRRQAAQLFNLSAPLDAELRAVPEKRKVDPTTAKEWHLQRDCIAAIRARQKVDKNLAYMAPGATQNNLTPAQRGFAKLMGWQAGLADVWLMRRIPDRSVLNQPWLKWHIVELKLPKNDLSDEQSAWFTWLRAAGITCTRCDNLAEFVKILDGF